MDAKYRKALFNQMDKDVTGLKRLSTETWTFEDVDDEDGKVEFLKKIYTDETVDFWLKRTRRNEFKAKDKELRTNRREARKFKLSHR